MTSNKRKKTAKWLATIAPIVGMGVTLLVLVLTMGVSSSSDSTGSTTRQEKVATNTDASNHSDTYGAPTRLVIPKIGVDTNILAMGLTTAGDMESPRTNEDSGWYKYGPRPGNIGSAVIAGHVGVGSSAVFSRLALLVKGDIVSVTDDRGQSVSFVVREMRVYDHETESSEVFDNSTGAYLNLITCSGDWNPERNTYAERLVIFTDKLI